MNKPSEVFFVERVNPNPDFYHPKNTSKLLSRRAIVQYVKGKRGQLRIYRAPVWDATWEDVTVEFDV